MCLAAVASLPATGATLVAAFFFVVGQGNRWTSDGPGMLGVMIFFAGAALVALALWTLVGFILFSRKVRAWLDSDERGRV